MKRATFELIMIDLIIIHYVIRVTYQVERSEIITTAVFLVFWIFNSFMSQINTGIKRQTRWTFQEVLEYLPPKWREDLREKLKTSSIPWEEEAYIIIRPKRGLHYDFRSYYIKQFLVNLPWDDNLDYWHHMYETVDKDLMHYL